MKIKISRQQWEKIGKKTGWIKESQNKKRELRKIDMKLNDFLTMPIIKTGTMQELNDFAKENGWEWIDKAHWMFKGYWRDKTSGESYIIT